QMSLSMYRQIDLQDIYFSPRYIATKQTPAHPYAHYRAEHINDLHAANQHRVLGTARARRRLSNRSHRDAAGAAHPRARRITSRRGKRRRRFRALDVLGVGRIAAQHPPHLRLSDRAPVSAVASKRMAD